MPAVRFAWPLAIGIALVAVTGIYLAALDRNPPGLNFDESSVAYNAYTIAHEGRDEHGASFPLYFRAFGEYKNPVYIYLLAGAFKLVEPSTLAARRSSAIVGIATVVTIAWLAWIATRNRKVALAALFAAAATPVIFEISRLVLEGAAFPLAVALFLVAARIAHDRPDWNIRLACALAATLALVTYAYTAGRLLGPLFAVLLFVFVTRRRLPGLILTLFLYALMLIPAAIFNAHHPGAFFQHARDVALRGSGLAELAPAVARNYVLNLDPINLALFGDPNARHHVAGSGGSILLMTFVLAAVGASLTWRTRWTAFLLLGMFVSVLPGALSHGIAHTLRLSALPPFLIALGFPAMVAPFDGSRKRIGAIVIAAFAAGAMQAAWFFAVFHRDGPHRPEMFDVGARPTLEAAIARGERPIYVEGRQYSHAYWFGALNGLDRSEIRLLAPGRSAPSGSIVYSDLGIVRDATVIARNGRYVAYVAP